MNLSFFIAKRYLISKKSHNAINIISFISVLGITVGTMALIIVLSVFNGFENLVVSLYNSFDSDLKITAPIGKTFVPQTGFYKELKAIEGVQYVSPVIEENALVKYNNNQSIATIKGMDPDYLSHTGIDTMLADGKMLLEAESVNYAVIGQGVVNKLSINIHDPLSYLQLYVPKVGAAYSALNPENAFTVAPISPSAVFAIQQDFDSKYILVSNTFAKQLVNYNDQVSAIEILLLPKANMDDVQRQIQKICGNKLLVKNRFQQHELLYKVMRSEKWAVFLILGFILLIATFNIIGSLTMLILEKKKDVQVLRSLGANEQFIQRLFLTEGMMISISGGIAGLVLGILVCFFQMQFGWIKMPGGGSFVVDSYPVAIKTMDVVFVLLTVLMIGFLAAWYPTKKMLAKSMIGTSIV
jgi:lipoprotein-releasing system permease protein